MPVLNSGPDQRGGKLVLPRLLVSAPHRSSGKSTVSAGLCAAFRERGLTVQPYKKGPDFIDPMWLSAAAGRQCHNLDFFLMGREKISAAFSSSSRETDLSLIEGNHGLHDGLDLEGSDSSAALACLLSAPVLLVVDASRITRGIAPLVRGHVEFEPDLPMAGIVLNRVNSRRHEEKLRATLKRYYPVTILGVLPYLPELEIAERHLGLTPLRESPGLEPVLENMGKTMARYLDLPRIIELARSAPPLPAGNAAAPNRPAPLSVRIGVAMDRAFNFYYPENLDALRAAGAELVPFSPLDDPRLPPVDGLYLGGGFPEFFLEALEANTSLREEIRCAIEKGLPVWAECGGLMYLARTVSWEGRRCRMVAALPCDIEMSGRPAGHGYVILKETGRSPWPQAGRELRGHEFHHSRIVELSENVEFAYRTLRGGGASPGYDGLIYRNCVATYTHLHTGGAPFWAADVVSFLRKSAYR